MNKQLVIAAAVLFLVACSKPKPAGPDTTRVAAAGAAASADPDKNVARGSIPSGFVARTDRSTMPVSGAKYVASGDGWEVTTGPAHILYAAKDVTHGNYTASATFDQIEAPAHPEAFGIFVGGLHIDQPNIAYTYFVVRGTGEMLVKLRDGISTKDIIPWTANAGVPKQDASGKASYTLAATVTHDSIQFSVNGKRVAAVGKTGLPTDGIAGIRVNHNLHVKVTPISIKAQ